MSRCCNRCSETDNVKDFVFFSTEKENGTELLCWDCRWPYIDRRLRPEPEPEPEPEPRSGQTGLGDFV